MPPPTRYGDLLALVAGWIGGGPIAALVEAARGDTGETAREVPLLFGIAGPVLAAAAAPRTAHATVGEGLSDQLEHLRDR